VPQEKKGVGFGSLPDYEELQGKGVPQKSQDRAPSRRAVTLKRGPTDLDGRKKGKGVQKKSLD